LPTANGLIRTDHATPQRVRAERRQSHKFTPRRSNRCSRGNVSTALPSRAVSQHKQANRPERVAIADGILVVVTTAIVRETGRFQPKLF
jgi:hypothetical protein